MGGQSSFDHGHVESLKKILDEILVCHVGILNFFIKIQHAYRQKMIDPQYDRPGYHLEFFLKIQYVHGQKMIDPPGMTDKDLI